MRLIILKKIKWESCDSETHETQGDYCGLMRLMRLVQTQKFMRLRETNGNS